MLSQLSRVTQARGRVDCRWRCVAILISVLCTSQVFAGELDDLVNRWREEANQLVEDEVPALLSKVKTSDKKSIFLAFAASDAKAKGLIQRAGVLNAAIEKLALGGDAMGLRMRCHSRIFAENGYGKSLQLGVADCMRSLNLGLGDAGEAVANAHFYAVGVARDYAIAIDALNQGVALGSASAAYELGRSYLNGRGVLQNDGLAAKWFTKAAESGNADAMVTLGFLSQTGRGLTQDETAALKWFTKAANAGNADGMYNLATMLVGNTGGEGKNDVDAVMWFSKAADQGNTDAMNSLGSMLTKGRGVAKNDAAARTWFKKGAEAGNTLSMTNLGIMLEDGRGGIRDEATAVEWYTKAAEAGVQGAMNNLGRMLLNGRGVAKNDAAAAAWFTKGASAGNTNSMVSLGLMLTEGHGLAKDDVAAMTWFRKAANQGNLDAKVNLASMFALGRGLPKDEEKAAKLFAELADGGFPSAMIGVGSMYALGAGVKKDTNTAARYFLQAVLSGSTETIFPTGRTVGNEAKLRLDCLSALGLITDRDLLAKIGAVSLRAPKLSWIALPATVGEESLVVRINVTDAGGGIGRVELRLNGGAVGEFKPTAGQRLASVSESVDGAVMEHTVRLSKGEHQLEVIAYNGENLINFTSLAGKLVSTYEAPRKPRLYAVVVGIDEFANERLRLKFAGSDAKAIAAALSDQIKRGDLYSGGKVVLLASRAETSKRSIKDAIAKFQQSEDVRADDVFVFFAATHGSMDLESRTFSLFSAEVLNLSADRLKETAISDLELRSLVANIPAAKKLILLDACQSGGALREVGAEGFVAVGRRSGMEEQQVIDMMRLRAGATVLAASTAEQSALEGYKGHGVFTWHLLEALGGKAARSGERWVSTDDLKIFVEANVPVVTKREFQQQQVPYASTVGQGFPVAVIAGK